MYTYRATLLFAALLIALGGTYWIVQEKNATYDTNSVPFVGRERVIQEEAQWYVIEAHYPAEVDLPREAGIRALAVVETVVENIVDSFKKSFATPNVEDQKFLTSLGRKYEQRITYTPHVSSNHVSYVFEIYEDTGGAHPNGHYRTLVFDQNGNGVKLPDLFMESADYLTRISGEAEQQVRREFAKRSGGSPEGGIFQEGLAPQAENFEHFVVDGDVLVFFIPPYQVAAYTVGSFEVRVPLEDLKDIVRPQ